MKWRRLRMQNFNFRNINSTAGNKQFFFDGGNLKIKYADTKGFYPALTHGLVEISQQELQEDFLFYRNSRNYIAIDIDNETRHFILGDPARNKLQGTLRQGAGRYVRDYIGVLAVWAICSLYAEKDKLVPGANIDFYAMYPPRDRMAKNNMINAIGGEWRVRHFFGMEDFIVNIPQVKAVFEPVGGYHCRILDDYGYVNDVDDVYNLDTLGVDIGSYTTDMFAADRGGSVDISAATSETIGIFQVIKNIESALLTAFAEELNHIPSLKYERLEAAIRTGKLQIGRNRYADVGEIVFREAKRLFAPIDAMVYGRGGAVSYECMLVMGGGGALLYPMLAEKYGDIIQVEPAINLEQMQYANVLGLQKMVRLLGA